MNQFIFDKNKLKIIAVIFLVIVLLISVNVVNGSDESEQSTFSTIPNEVNSEKAVEEVGDKVVDKEASNKDKESIDIFIDIKGAVLKPNVYKLEDGSRVQDAIQIAGGFLENADQTKINLAARVRDEMVIYVPKVGEEIEDDASFLTTKQDVQGENEGERININTATTEQLQTLPGIGAAKAASIISYRDENGRFAKIEDLVNVSGIGEKSLEKFKDKITIN